jgi:hypothetical protein
MSSSNPQRLRIGRPCNRIDIVDLPPGADALEVGWRIGGLRLRLRPIPIAEHRTLLSSAPLERSGAAGGMLATARLTGQTAGATPAAIAFRFSTMRKKSHLGWLPFLRLLRRSSVRLALYIPGHSISSDPAR